MPKNLDYDANERTAVAMADLEKENNIAAARYRRQRGIVDRPFVPDATWIDTKPFADAIRVVQVESPHHKYSGIIRMMIVLAPIECVPQVALTADEYYRFDGRLWLILGDPKVVTNNSNTGYGYVAEEWYRIDGARQLTKLMRDAQREEEFKAAGPALQVQRLREQVEQMKG
jgi:hypothetical protein